MMLLFRNHQQALGANVALSYNIGALMTNRQLPKIELEAKVKLPLTLTNSNGARLLSRAVQVPATRDVSKSWIIAYIGQRNHVRKT